MSQVCISVFCLFLAQAPKENWPSFRGGERMGVSDKQSLPESWSATKSVIWSQPIAGLGWSSPIVWGDRIFLTSVTVDGKFPEPKKGLYFGGEQSAASKETHHWLVVCLDWKTGKQLWQREAHTGVPPTPVHIKNTYASETPVTDGERVYAYFGNTGLYCYDVDGKPLWHKSFGAYPTMFQWGTASSPVLHKDRLYIQDDNEKSSFLVALNKVTGEEIWRVRRDEKSTWATPFVWENEQRTEIICCGKNKNRSYDLSGKVLWELGGMSNLVIPTPMAKFGLLYLTSGYVLDQKQPIFAVRPGASGDISLLDNQDKNDFVVWSQKRSGPYNPTPVLYGDYLYVLYDRGFLACYEAKTGKEIYGKTRIGPGATAFTSSAWASDGKIYCLSEDGDTYVVQAGPSYKLLGRHGLDEMCMATPAVLRGSMLIRTASKLYRIGNPTR